MQAEENLSSKRLDAQSRHAFRSSTNGGPRGILPNTGKAKPNSAHGHGVYARRGKGRDGFHHPAQVANRTTRLTAVLTTRRYVRV